MTKEKRCIAVIGATGAQGGGLVRAILRHPEGPFVVRAITRKPDSPKAQELSRLGAEVVAADADQPASLEKAFDGAWGAFCVTNYWEHFSPERELKQAAALAEAAKRGGVQHVIWSTLEDTRRWVPLDDGRMPTLMGKYKTPHFDSKGEADEQFRSRHLPVTFLLTSFYWENLIYFGSGPKRTPGGQLELVVPMGGRKLPGIATEDIGKCAFGIFSHSEEFLGRQVGIAGEHLTGPEMAEQLSRALGEQVTCQDVTPEEFRQFGFPGAEDLGNMFQFKRDFNEYFCGARSVAFSRSVNPELQSFAAWLRRHAHQIPLA